MKTLYWVVLLAVITSHSRAQLVSVNEWKATLKVVDEEGVPVAGAKTWVSFYTMSAPGQTKGSRILGLTDTNGIFVASHRDGSYYLGFHSEKAGFYSFNSEYPLGFSSEYTSDKWHPTLTVVLRKIGNPIPMYAKQQRMKLPKEDGPIGFDLMAADWIAPYGLGTHTDIYFTVHRKIINDREFTGDLTVAFPNKGDGIAVAQPIPNTGSEFKTARTALQNGYESALELHYSNTKHPLSVFGYFIRVRTELDRDGNVKSALYGKIVGGFRFYAGTVAPTAGMGFDYYLNPAPNDRNVEFNPQKNLIKNLNPSEKIEEP